jgi:septum formation protein
MLPTAATPAFKFSKFCNSPEEPQMPASPPSRLVLASQSPRRQELLSGLGLKFECLPSDIDEKTDLTEPQEVVVELAYAKAKAVADLLNGQKQEPGACLILGADTIVVLGREIMGKPSSREDAYQMLMRMSGRCHKVFTGVALLNATDGTVVKDYAQSDVYFRSLDPTEVRSYVKTDEPMDKAGAYALQGTASCFVEKIQGCYTNIIGLPVPLTVRLLRQSGVSVLGLP